MLDSQEAWKHGSCSNDGGEPARAPAAGVHLHNRGGGVPDGHELYLWLADPAGRLDLVASVESAYDDAGNCPGSGVGATDVNVSSAGSHHLIAVDPEAIGCGVNDPSVLACQRQWIAFQGDPSGGVLTWTVPAP